MHNPSVFWCVVIVGFVVFLMEKEVVATPGHYTPTWSVHIHGGREVADQVAAELGFDNLGEIVLDHYHFHHKDVVKRSATPSSHHHDRLNKHERVKWLRQEVIISRKKRDFLPLTLTPQGSSPTISTLGTPLMRLTNPTNQTTLSSEREAERKDRDISSAERRSRYTIPITMDSQFPLNDQRWQEMWYLNRGGGLDMNVVEAWKEGVTGRGIVVTILDDGLEKDHPDLLANYDAQASYDVNNHDEDPMPRYDMVDSNRHGTRCAGEVAATANNTLCAVGVAYGAGVGGVRMLDGDVTDAVEARSLSLNPQHIDIYSASWGPDDDGKTVDGPGELATRAFVEGVTKGRNGKGSIFVWASGNGGNERDNCNCDGYTNSIWTLSISSATENGEVPWYSEMCSSTLATTYSSGSTTEKQVITTDLHHSCTSSHTGTSASAPLAAGICALALEANRDLTWRDMQHIVVRTAKPANLQATTWRTNGVGRNVSHSFGYGLMDAAAMVRLARNWRTVPIQHRCEVTAPHTEKSVSRLIPPKSQVTLQLSVNQCVGVNYLEHVQAKISLTAARRGDLEINLTSPAGTRVTLLAPRTHDISRAGFNMWPFMSVHTWGESPYGIWLLEIHNEGKFMAELTQWDLIFYGTEVPPQGEADYNPQSKSDVTNSGIAFNMGEGEVGQHNSLNEDRTLEKWRDIQKVRDDGRQPTSEKSVDNNIAKSGCLSSSPSQCIECHPEFYLYSGQCYKTCLVGTFASVRFTSQTKKPKKLAIPISKEDISTSLRKKKSVNHRKSIKKSNTELLQSRDVMRPDPPKYCKDCHYSCLSCSGPYLYECTACHGDAKLVTKTNDGNTKQSYCYPSHIIPEIENSVWLRRFYVLFGIIIFLSVCVLFYLIITKLLMKCSNYKQKGSNASSSVGYNRLGSAEEQSKSGANVVKEIHSAIYDDSESDSDCQA